MSVFSGFSSVHTKPVNLHTSDYNYKSNVAMYNYTTQKQLYKQLQKQLYIHLSYNKIKVYPSKFVAGYTIGTPLCECRKITLSCVCTCYVVCMHVLLVQGQFENTVSVCLHVLWCELY